MEVKLKAAVQQRDTLLEEALCIVRALEGCNSKSVLKTKLSRLTGMAQSFNQFESTIAEGNINIAKAKRYSIVPERLQFFDVIDKVQLMIYELEDEVRVQTVKPEGNSSHAVESNAAYSMLKPLELPKLEETNYEFFMEMFNSLVHENPQLTDCMKYHYLVQGLGSAAKGIISGYLPISAENYLLAREALSQHFNNKRRTAARYINEILAATAKTNADLPNLLRIFTQNIAALKKLGVNDLGEVLLFQILYQKINSSLRLHYERKNPDVSVLKGVDDLVEFLRSQVNAFELEKIANSPTSVPKEHPPAHPKGSRGTVLAVSESGNKQTPHCVLCEKQHFLYNCDKFAAMSFSDRHEVIKAKQVCYACFGPHQRSRCPSKYHCKHCKSEFHHSLLCRTSDNYRRTRTQEPNDDRANRGPPKGGPLPTPNVDRGSTSNNDTALSANSSSSLALLATANVEIVCSNSEVHQIRCVVDPGSQLNFITEKFAQLLCTRRHQDSRLIKGIAGTSQSRGRVILQVRSQHDKGYLREVEFLILPKICDNLPPQRVSPDFCHLVEHLELADTHFGIPGAVHMLLGASFYADVISADQPVIKIGGSVAQYTSLGYLILGNTEVSAECPTSLLSIDAELAASVARLWEIEADVPVKAFSPEEEAVEQFYQTTTTRDECGRYVVRLPFKENAVPLLVNRHEPMRSYLSVERRLDRQPEVAELYHEFFSEFVSNGMMEKAKEAVNYKLLHHPVLKNSNTTKVRPVMNGSSPDLNGRSLNGQLLNGPALQADIFDVLLSFRLNPVPFICDIRRMYNSILIHPDDRQYQHILWRPSPRDEVFEYELNRVTFGLGPSAFLAQRTIQQLVLDEGADFPLASQILQNQIYVDDALAALSTVREAVTAKNELISLMEKGGFELRKFASSYPQLLSGLPAEHCEDVKFDDADATLKILGLAWSPTTDCFRYNVTEFTGAATKRSILSYAARIFDVKGLLAPVTLAIKLLLKKLWLNEYDWDTQLSDELANEWLSVCRGFPLLRTIEVPRHIPVLQCDLLELIGFSDGSSVGHGAAIYLRCVIGNQVTIQLVKARSKVNPIKPQLTIPRAELQAAHLLAKMYDSLKPSFSGLEIHQTHFCTDSTIVLGWLNTPPHKLQLFVSNRVASITSKTNVADWRHVPSACNAADPASRSTSPQELCTCELWWKGPDFLSTEPAMWPACAPSPLSLPEMKQEKACTLLSVNPDAGFDKEIVSRFKSLGKMTRVLAWMKRFVHNVRSRSLHANPKAGPLSIKELSDASDLAVQLVQQQYFPKGDVPQRYKSLTPFKDSNGYIRVGGRLDAAPLAANARHPVLVPNESHLAFLLCTDAHVRSLHGGPLVMKAVLQSRYWIVGVQRLLKRCLFECVRCYRLKAKPPEPQMGELPPSRFSEVRAFHNTSTDFAGPFLVHEGSRPRARTIKVYVCVFTCMSTRATHLEVVQDLSTESFLAAVDRFTARRGLVSLLYGDNGTNYQGASRVLKEVKEFLSHHGSEVEQLLSTRQIAFQFVSPVSPWKNGISERIVGLFKHHLTRVIGNLTLTFCEFETLVVRIEGVLNSRPLIPLSIDPDDVVLTPGHFLIGSAILAPPEVNVSESRVNTLSRWQVIRSSLQSFWKHWRHHYLQTLMERTRWKDPVPNLVPGMVVVIKGENTPPLTWPLAVVEEVLPGKDKCVRVVRVRTSAGKLVRPVNKLIPLNV